MQFVNDMSLADYVSRGLNHHDQVIEDSSNWMGSAIPASGVLGLISPSSRKTSEADTSPFSFRVHEPASPESGVTSEASDFAYTKELDKEGPRIPLYLDDLTSESSESRCDSFERATGIYETGPVSPNIYSSTSKLKRVESFESIYR